MPEQGQIATNWVKGSRGFTQLKYRWESQNRWKLSVKFSKALLEQTQVLQFSHLHAFMPQYEAATLARPTGGAQASCHVRYYRWYKTQPTFSLEQADL